MDLNLKDKIAFVAGSSQGLGYAAAKGLAQEGARVVINGRDPARIEAAAEKLSGETGADVYPLTGDVTDVEVAESLIEKAVNHTGGLDILITNSGGPPSGKFMSLAPETWQHAVQLSFLSHVWLIRAALPHLKASATPSVLTITSYAVKQPIPNLVLSNSIRAATAGLTKSLALELGAEGIRFNSILPGWTETERVQELMAFRADANQTSLEEETRKQAAASALGRMAQPEEIANAAVFLLSPAASYITGVMLTVDGGAYMGTF